MKTIAYLLAHAAHLLPHSDTAVYDMELLLTYLTNKPCPWLYAQTDSCLTNDQAAQLDTLLEQRNQLVPIAYLLESAHFWSLELMVNASVLVPRSDSELLVELVLADCDHAKHTLLDIGTGSGALALALAHERPNWSIIGFDLSPAALQVAEHNAVRHGLSNLAFHVSDVFAALPCVDAFGHKRGVFDIIVSNPPYLAASDPHLPNLRHEPQTALVAGDTGLELYQRLATESAAYLRDNGRLYLEHGNEQGHAVRTLLADYGFVNITTHTDLQGWERVTTARTP